MIDELAEYVEKHTTPVSRSVDNDNSAVDVGFFKVLIDEKADTETFRSLIKSSLKGEFDVVIDPLDGDEHRYIELGAWIGDQELAMRFMALTSHFKMAQLLTPKVMMGQNIDPALESKLLNAGYCTIRAKHEPS